MVFENISKGEFETRKRLLGKCEFEYEIYVPPYWIAHTRGDSNEEAQGNAQFIAFCFNLQQRYDISKLEEAVRLLETQISCLNAGFDITANSVLHEEIKVILKQIKK